MCMLAATAPARPSHVVGPIDHLTNFKVNKHHDQLQIFMLIPPVRPPTPPHQLQSIPRFSLAARKAIPNELHGYRSRSDVSHDPVGETEGPLKECGGAKAEADKGIREVGMK